jgi:ribosomal protein S18 acetylase RimI-like enzyme
MPDDITIARLDPADIELVAPLWKALLDHVAVLPEAVVPIRPFEQSWPLERKIMLDALEGDAFIMVGRRGGKSVAYCFVTIEDADPVWYTGEQYAEIRHLSVAEDERGSGIGSALLDAVDELLEERGIVDVQIGVDQANDDALRFYEARGFRSDYCVVYGSPGGKEWACLAREKADREAGRGRFAPPGPGTP